MERASTHLWVPFSLIRRPQTIVPHGITDFAVAAAPESSAEKHAKRPVED
jgi:hypothetical protein